MGQRCFSSSTPHLMLLVHCSFGSVCHTPLGDDKLCSPAMVAIVLAIGITCVLHSSSALARTFFKVSLTSFTSSYAVRTSCDVLCKRSCFVYPNVYLLVANATMKEGDVTRDSRPVASLTALLSHCLLLLVIACRQSIRTSYNKKNHQVWYVFPPSEFHTSQII